MAMHAACLFAMLFTSVAAEFPNYAALRARAQAEWTAKNADTGTTLVLVPSDSPLLKAAQRLASFQKAEVLTYSPSAPDRCLETLIRKQARWVTVFAEPRDMDVNLVRSFVVLSTLMDDDPFCDFAFGFVTASTPARVGEFVSRIIQARRVGVEQQSAAIKASDVTAQMACTDFGAAIRGNLTCLAEGDLRAARNAIDHVKHAGFVYLGGCADPEGLWLFNDQRNLDPSKHWKFDPKRVGQDPKGEMPRITAHDFCKLKLENAVVWTHACHVGSVERLFVEGDIVSTFGTSDQIEEYRIPAGRSVALAVIESGASAYVAPLGPNFGMQAMAELAVARETRMPLGDVMRRAYHDIVMDTEGHPEAIGLYQTGLPAHTHIDGFVNNNSPHNRCLYGDPRFAPFREQEPASVRITSKEAAGGISVKFELTASGYLGRTWYGNRGDTPGEGRIYETVQLPRHVAGVTLGEIRALDAAGKPFEIIRKTALLERIDGQTLLHLQLVTDQAEHLRCAGATVEVLVKFEMKTVQSR